MVVFTCGHCGESVQKPKVEKHYNTKCRNRNPNLSCMDCFKDFFGKEYESHMKCISEEQRYGGKGFVAKEKKGEQKQGVWVDLVQSVLDEQKDAPKNVLKIIEGVSKHQNTPRKKPKFLNFVKNVCGHKTDPSDIEAAWDLLSVKLSQLSTSNKNRSPQSNSPKLNEKLNGSDTKIEETIDEQEVKTEEINETEVERPKSKKERKEEKKRNKYEAELRSALVMPEEEVEEEKLTKKEKKARHKSETAAEADAVENVNGKSKKNKKRKRADTVNEVNGDVIAAPIIPVVKENGKVEEKPQLKKPKAVEEENDESKKKFNWHSTIIEVLQKKGNEIPFKRLQKKVLGEYSESTGYPIDDRIAEKFIKKLKSAPNVLVDKNKVVLIE